MVTTCGDIIREAYRIGGKLGGDDDLLPSEYNNALTRLQAVILAMPGMTNWTDVEVTADYEAGEDERVRVATTDAVTVTVPESVASSQRVLWCCNQVTLVCTGYDDRAPRDGSKVHIADAYSDACGTYFYRSDIAQWTSARDLTKDSEVPFSADFDRYLEAILADELFLDLHPKYAALAQEGRMTARSRYSPRKAVGTRFPTLSANHLRNYR
jgi:hypothetical protein